MTFQLSVAQIWGLIVNVDSFLLVFAVLQVVLLCGEASSPQ